MRQRGASFVGIESVMLFDANPRQLLPPPRQVIAAPRQLLLGFEQFQPGGKPFFACSSLMLSHCFLLLFGWFVFVVISICEWRMNALRRLSSADDNLAEVGTSLEMTKCGADLVKGELAINDRTNPPRFDCAQHRQQVGARTDADATNADQLAENLRDVDLDFGAAY